MEFEEGQKDCMNLCGEFSRRRNDDCTNMMLLGRFIQAQ